MPDPSEPTRKNLYVRPADRGIWTRAEQLAGDSLSAFVAEALRNYLRVKDRDVLTSVEAQMEIAERFAEDAQDRLHMAESRLAHHTSHPVQSPDYDAVVEEARRDHDLASERAHIARANLSQTREALEQARERVNQREQEESDRIVVDLWNTAGCRYQKAFRGHWLLSPSEGFREISQEGREVTWAVAETLRGRFVVYVLTGETDLKSGEGRNSFEVYESFDDMAAAVPHQVREEVRTRTGRVEVEELDI